MVTLTNTERSTLEKAVLRAREVAEVGVRKRLAALDLENETRPAGIGDEDNDLRKALRVRARHLGRGRTDPHLANREAVAAGTPFLVEELAYEVWHRMLFARFLAENDLLTHPELNIPVSTSDLFALASEEGGDPWELAAIYAANRVPGLFALKTPLRLATEDRQDLAGILADLDTDLFTASDSLGWVYQYWQTERKKEVNRSGNKIDGTTLPAVTQLFTEDYMVDFLLQNSLGAWYVARHPETALRDQWPYLRVLDDGTPAAGTFPTWPGDIAEITVMDPCCGSGHFLVAALHMLAQMRAEVEGISLAEATDLVLQHNLFGLELDARCTQIAIFAVALEAWKLGGHPERFVPQIACSGIPVGGQKDEWLALAQGDDTMRHILSDLYELFSQAADLGSLIDPRSAISIGDMWKYDWSAIERRIAPLLERQQQNDPVAGLFTTDELQGTARAARLLADRYTLIATNVPYLARGSQGDAMKQFADRHCPDAKADLATMFLERCLAFVRAGDGQTAGTVASVTPQNWLFLGSYKKLRETLLVRDSLNVVARLGPGAFRAITGQVVNVALSIITATPPAPTQTFAGLDVSDGGSPDEKEHRLRVSELRVVSQADQCKHPGSVVSDDSVAGSLLLERFADGLQGIATADYPRYGRGFWERPLPHWLWRYQQSTVESTIFASGREHIVPWDETIRPTPFGPGCRLQGQKAWGQRGVAVSQMRELPVTLYTGELFDNNTAVILPKNPDHLPAIWAFCSSPAFNIAVRKIDAALKVTNASLVKVPFDLDHWQKVADERYPNGLPEPYSSDPTQWIFEGLIPDADHPLQVAMARLLGYRWPEQVEDGLDGLSDRDGIVCLPSVYGEQPAHQRLLDVLQRAYGDRWSGAVSTDLLRQVDAPSLEEWLASKKGFFAQHVKIFHNRPFLWHITDGRKDGFSAIVNYHRLDLAAMNKLIHTYLGDWIGRQQRGATQGEAGAQGRLEAATALKRKLEAIVTGEPPYDLYVRWKSLAEQPIGWQPDLNDGVRLNIRPFIEAGVLMNKVTVDWNKDRGKDPFVRDEPLLATTRDTDLGERIALHCSVDRWNDLHFTRAEKEEARRLAAGAKE